MTQKKEEKARSGTREQKGTGRKGRGNNGMCQKKKGTVLKGNKETDGCKQSGKEEKRRLPKTGDHWEKQKLGGEKRMSNVENNEMNRPEKKPKGREGETRRKKESL